MTDRRNFTTNYVPILLTFFLTIITTLGGSWIYLRDSVLSNTKDNLKYHVIIDAHTVEIKELREDIIQVQENQLYSGDERADFKSLLRQNLELMTELQLTLTTKAASTDVKLENITKRLDRAGI